MFGRHALHLRLTIRASLAKYVRNPAGRAALGWVSLCIVVPGTAAAQTIGGRVLDSASRKPLVGVNIAAIQVGGDSINATETDSGGVFYVNVPHPGRYQLKFRTFNNAPLFGDTVVLRDGDFVEKLYVLSLPATPVYFEFQVEKTVAPMPGNRPPRYPDDLRQQGISGHVLVQFVVDTMGRVEPVSIKTLRSTHETFVDAVRSHLMVARYQPAELKGQRVRQLVQQPFNFCLTPSLEAGC